MRDTNVDAVEQYKVCLHVQRVSVTTDLTRILSCFWLRAESILSLLDSELIVVLDGYLLS